MTIIPEEATKRGTASVNQIRRLLPPRIRPIRQTSRCTQAHTGFAEGMSGANGV
jgi:hypothetical protein